ECPDYSRSYFAERCLGIHPYSRHELAPADDDFAHARLPVIRFEAGLAPFYKCLASYRSGHPSFSRAATNDARTVAERFCRRRVRHSSIARRIGGLDRREKGRPERRVFHADIARIHPLRDKTLPSSIRTRLCSSCLRPNGQAHACDRALRIVASRLLAAAARWPARVAPDCRENAADRSGHRIQHHNVCRPERGSWLHRSITRDNANQQRHRQLCYLPVPDVLAGKFGGFLSASRKPSAALGAGAVRGFVDCHFAGGAAAAGTQAVSRRWLVMVSRDAGTGNWSRTGRLAGARGPIYVPARDWSLYRNHLDHCRRHGPLATSANGSRRDRGSRNFAVQLADMDSDDVLA